MNASIEQLCDEILVEVFRNLNADTLKKASLVCKKWNDVIGSSSQTMRKFTWRLQGRYSPRYWNPECEEIMKLQRRPWKIDVSLSEQDDVNLLGKVLERHGSQVRSFSLTSYANIDYNKLGTILNYMPMVKELSLNACGHEQDLDDTLQQIKPMKFLQTLSVKTGGGYAKLDWQMFKILKTVDPSKIKELSLFNNSVKGLPALVLDFLMSAVNLKKLLLNEQIFEQIFTRKPKELISFPFKLRKFTVDCELPDFLRRDVPQGPRHNEITDGFMAFLDTQADTLEELDAQYNFHRKAFQAIFTKLEKIKVLHIKFNALPKDKEFYEALKPMANLQTIRSIYQCAEETAKKGILKCCPEVREFGEKFFFQSLRMNENAFEGIIEFISIHNTKMEVLSIKSIYTQDESNVKLGNLKTVNIHAVEDRDYLMNFLTVNSTIENVFVNEYEGKTLEPINLHALVSHPALKRFSISKSEESMEKMYQGIKGDKILHNAIEREERAESCDLKFQK